MGLKYMTYCTMSEFKWDKYYCTRGKLEKLLDKNID